MHESLNLIEAFTCTCWTWALLDGGSTDIELSSFGEQGGLILRTSINFLHEIVLEWIEDERCLVLHYFDLLLGLSLQGELVSVIEVILAGLL